MLEEVTSQADFESFASLFLRDLKGIDSVHLER